jgi:predicted nucleotidyltransferase
MRLLELERTALLKALQGVDGHAYLYGSRVDPGRKGGDIDVLVFSRTRDPYRVAQDITVRFQMVCDEKIDVLVVDPERMQPEQRSFVDLVMRSSAPLI